MEAAEIRQLFPGLQDTIYFNTASMNVGSAPAREAYERALELWSSGRFDWTEAERAGEEARVCFAAIIGAAAGEIAIVPAVSTAAGIVAANLPTAKHGENVVVAENEFTSNYYPWLMLRERGYEVRTVAPRGRRNVGRGVQTSCRRRYAPSRCECRSIGNWLSRQPAGHQQRSGKLRSMVVRRRLPGCRAVPLDVVRDGVDFLASASHKFLLGSGGMGYLYVRRDLLHRIRPVGPGWKAARKPAESFYGPAMDLSPSASKLDTSLAWFPAVADAASLSIFSRFGTDTLLERNSQLTLRLQDALSAQGLSFHHFPDENRSTIVSVQVGDTEAVLARFHQANVRASIRAGNIRLSVHFYNLEEEIDRVAELIGRS